jgi:hypothetical protein
MASPDLSASRLHALLNVYHEKIFQIESLERRIDARAVLTRRRLANLLDSQRNNSHRPSHMRVFVTHKLVPPPPPPPPDPSVTVLVQPDPPPPEYRIQIEGRLLVGHLDHESAAAFDQRTGYTAPIDELDRSKGEQEEADVAPISFTHFFSRAVVELEPLYVQKPNPMSKKAAKSPPPSKKSRRGSTKSPNPSSAAASLEEEVDPSTLVRGTVVTLEWKRGMTGDAHMFCFHYRVPAPPGYHLMPHSVATKIRLYSARHDDLWLPNDAVPALATIFSSHITADEPVPAAAAAATTPAAGATSKSKKRKADDITPTAAAASSSSTAAASAVTTAAGGASASREEPGAAAAAPSSLSSAASQPQPLPPLSLENSIDIPQGLSWKEICMAFFVYVQDRRLMDAAASDRSVVVCDELLRELFQVERFPFSQLQRLLQHRGLFVKISDEPVQLSYLLRPETALPSNDRDLSKEQLQNLHSSLLQLDMDVSVPSLFPYRCRELLRRIKRRELEYTSSRTKARYLLATRRSGTATASSRGAEEAARALVDDVVREGAIHSSLEAVLAAIAKSTPPRTEARMAVHYDLRMGYLVERVREHLHAAQEAWQVVARMRSRSAGATNLETSEANFSESNI